MLRTGASRLALRSIAAPSAVRPAASFHRAAPSSQWTTKFGSMAARRPQISQLTPIQSAVFHRRLTEDQKAAERKYAQEKLKPTPETVSATSSITGSLPGSATAHHEEDVDMMASVKHDVDTIKDTFSLSAVPRQAYYMGLAGTLPYLATSISTVYCAWEINHSVAGYGYLLSASQATTLLHFLEPVQVGYGAVILSFLGAIHWGLEWAGYGGYQGYKRYAIGVLAPAVAWPTLLLPVEYALISQFFAFTVLYWADTRATYKGWTPPWYAIYRFILTFVVGASIVLSLIGRGEISENDKNIPGPVERLTQFGYNSPQRLAREEEAIRLEKAEKARASKSEDEGKDESEDDNESENKGEDKAEDKGEDEKKSKEEK